MPICRDCVTQLIPVPGTPVECQPLLCSPCRRKVRSNQKKRAKARKPKKLGPQPLSGTPKSRALSRTRIYTDSLKLGPCQDCGNVFPPCAMDFDHRPGEVKVLEISKCKTRTQVDLEVPKCDLVCANCHRIRTWKRGLSTNVDGSLIFQNGQASEPVLQIE